MKITKYIKEILIKKISVNYYSISVDIYRGFMMNQMVHGGINL